MARLNKEREAKLLSFVQDNMMINNDGKLIWLFDDWRKAKNSIVGKQVGRVENVGEFRYLIMYIPAALGSGTMMANRCAWALHTGEFPKGSVVNLDGDILNFKKDNLGEYDPRVNHAISCIQNHINRKDYKIGRSNEYYVAQYWDDPADIHSAQSNHKFDTYENAMNARIRASEERIKFLKSTLKTLV